MTQRSDRADRVTKQRGQADREVAPAAEPSDGDLVIRARDGDQAAFGVLVRRYQRRLFALGIRYFRQPADADDLVQETFLRAWRALDRFDETRPFAPWLLRIGANWALTQLETRRRRGGEELGEDVAWSGPSPQEEAESARLRQDVNRAVARLPQEQRVVLHLRANEGLSYREIADTLELPIGTVMSRLSRARETLRREVER